MSWPVFPCRGPLSVAASRTASIARIGLALACLALVMGLEPTPAAADPVAYVANQFFFTVSVIDTATNSVAATVPVASDPFAGDVRDVAKTECRVVPPGVATAEAVLAEVAAQSPPVPGVDAVLTDDTAE